MNALVHMLSAIFVPLFFVGMVGSVAVVIFTVIRDLRQIFTPDEGKDGADL